MSYAVAQYRSAKIQTATPLQILVALYDGAIRFMKQAGEACKQGNVSKKGVALNRAHAIVSELQATLDASHAPQLCENLDRLYEFVLFRIQQANLRTDSNQLTSAITVMEQLRSAWSELLTQELR